MNENYTISAFTHRIADLPDQPNLSPSELKARFDACPEELRVAHNALCEDAARLGSRVDGIITETFGGAITEPMLDPDLRATLATQADLAAERQTTEQALAQKCEVLCGTYTGNGRNGHEIELGFAADAVLVIDPVTDTADTTRRNICGLGVRGSTANHVLLTDTGFMINIMTTENVCLNQNRVEYVYLAFRKTV